MRLPQLKRIGRDFETMVQHAARIGVVVVLGGRELLDQLSVALQWSEVERGEQPARERCALPDVAFPLGALPLPLPSPLAFVGSLWV